MKEIKKIKLSICLIMCLSSQVYADNSATTLKEIDIVGGEDPESYTTNNLNTSTKLKLSLRDTPQMVSVFTKQKMDDLNISSYQELMSNIPGVTATQTDERLYPTSRGFSIDYYQFDGIPTYSIAMDGNNPDLSIFERVEVVKGANGLMTGAGNPALGLNFIRKHANSKELKGSINLSGGSWDKYAAQTDISTPLNSDGSIRARVVAKHENQNSYMDKYEKTTDVLYGVVDMDLTDSTYLSFSAGYENIKRDGVRWGGLPAFYTDGSKTNFDRSKTVSSDWTYWNTKTLSFNGDFKQYFFDDMSFNLAYSHRKIYTDTNITYFSGSVDKSTGVGVGDISRYANHGLETEDNIDMYVSAPFNMGGLDHEIIFGNMYTQHKNKYNDTSDWTVTGLSSSLSNPEINFNNINIANTNLSPTLTTTPNKTKQTGTYLVGKFSLLEDLKLITGARLSNWEYKSDDGAGNRKFKNEVTPYVGLVYDINDNHSIYASYTSIFKPQDRKNTKGNYLDPIVGKSYETGIKGEYFDGALNAALSIFRIEQDNVAEEIDGGFVIGTSDQAYEGKAGVVSKGFEISTSGKITDNLVLDFGIANFEAKSANGEKYNTTSSRTTANLFAKYKIDKFNIGAGLNYKSKIYTGTGDKKITQSAYTTVNTMIAYKVNKDLDLQLNINNIFDKKYYAGIGSNSMVYGTPRNATISLEYRF